MPLGGCTQRPSSPIAPWQQCVAKSREDGSPGLSVAEHSRNVAEVARALLEVMAPPVLRRLGGAPVPLAAVHDVGKVSPGFLKKILGEYITEFCPELAQLDRGGLVTNHALISEAALNAHLGATLESADLAIVAGAHHGRRSEGTEADTGSAMGGEGWARERRGFLDALLAEYGDLVETPRPDLDVLAGFLCVADWIGSDETSFPAEGLPAGVDRRARAQEAVAACGWAPIVVEPDLSFGDVFGLEPFPMQRDFFRAVDGPGLYVLEAPMGLGKTEAALYAAYRLMAEGHGSGLYFGLPTRLTSDKIHERVSKFIKRISKGNREVRLAHGQAWMRAFERGGEELGPGKPWFRPSKRSLLLPFAVGTIDQALLAVLKVRHHFIRCFGLAGKVVILDEVHSYDVYTGTLLDLLVRRLLQLGCTVIILSATLTRARKQEFFDDPAALGADDSYPLTSVQRPGLATVIASEPPKPRRVEVSICPLPARQVAERAVAKASTGHSVLCIANTVAMAQEWYQEVKTAMNEGAFKVGLLHSAFPAWRRRELEEQWMARLGKGGDRSEGCVLVATQVVEQSVDIDADLMITELAPTDMLLQRLGRLWRHSYPARPCPAPSVIIVTGDMSGLETFDDLKLALGEANCRVYQPYVLWRSHQVLRPRAEVSLPDEIKTLLEATYEAQDDEPEYLHEAKADLERKRERLRALAQNVRADKTGFCTMEDDERAATRYSEIPRTGALLVRSSDIVGTSASLVLSSGQMVKVDQFSRNPWVSAQLHSNVVAVPCYRLPRFQKPRFLARHFHEATAVLVISNEAELMLDGTPTGLQYDNERGLQPKRRDKTTSVTAARQIPAPGDDENWEGGLDEFGW